MSRSIYWKGDSFWSPQTSVVFHQPGLSQLGFVVVEQSQGAAQQPAGGIAHGDGDDLIPDTAHNKQVHLPECNKRGEHDDHGCFAVAGAAQSTGVDLIEAAQDIERGDPPQQHGTVLHHFRFAVEESDDLRCEQQNGHHQDQCGDQSEGNGAGDTLLGPFHLIAAQILAHKGGGGQGNGLHGQEQQLIYLCVGGPAGHTVVTEEIDIGLNENVGEGSDSHLDGGGDAHPEDLLQHIPVELQFLRLQLDAFVGSEKGDENQNGGGSLSDDGCQSNTPDTHVKDQNEHQIQNGIHDGADHKEVEGPLRVAHGPQDSGTDVVEHQAHDAAEVNTQVGGGFRQNIGGGVHQPEHERCHGQTDAGEQNAQNEGHGQGGVDGAAHILVALGTVVLADDDTGTGGQTHKEADEHVHDGADGAHGGVGLVADIAAHHPGVHHVVHLLENIACQQGEGEGDQMLCDVALSHIHILAPFGGQDARAAESFGSHGHDPFLCLHSFFIIAVIRCIRNCLNVEIPIDWE